MAKDLVRIFLTTLPLAVLAGTGVQEISSLTSREVNSAKVELDEEINIGSHHSRGEPWRL